MIQHRVPSLALGITPKLVDHPHIGPVIFKLVAAIQADNVVLSGRRGYVPFGVDGASHGDWRGGSKRLGEFFMRTTN